MTEESYLSTHRYVRYLVFVAAAMVVVAFGVWLFGPDRVAEWIEAIGAWVSGWFTPDVLVKPQ